MIGSFLDLLTLPDSRFQVSLILDFLRLPALQRKFGLSTDELSTIEWWLSEACVHWGLDGEHKQQFTGQESLSKIEQDSVNARRHGSPERRCVDCARG